MQATPTAIELLDQMRGAILTADFPALAVLTPQLETVLDQVDFTREPQLLGQIKARAERNAALLLAAGRGVRAAQRRLADLREAKTGFSTYDGNGKRELHATTSAFARRF